jgi:hypothetical protein
MRRSRAASFRYAREIVPSDDYPTRIVACIALASVTAVFFLMYSQTFHSYDVRTPSLLKQTVASHPALGRAALITALEPDMHSDSIRFANSDVISPPIKVTPSPQVTPASKSKATKPARHIPKSKATKRLPPDAANAYASEKYYYSRPEIGAE